MLSTEIKNSKRFKYKQQASLEGKFENLDDLSKVVELAMKGVKPKVFYSFKPDLLKKNWLIGYLLRAEYIWYRKN